MGLGLLMILISIVYFFPSWPLTLLNLNEEIKVDHDFSSKYISIINPEGEKNILEAVNIASKLNSTDDKLNSIFEWELNDWVNPRWGATYSCLDPGCRYFYYNNDKSKIRADVMYPPRFGTIYFPNDPAWIAYYKTGACQEISVLFADTANRSGFQTHTVYWVTHQWTEININGEWWYYDPVCSYEKYRMNMTDYHMWFNKTKYFRTNCYPEAYLVFDTKNWYDPTPTIRYYV